MANCLVTGVAGFIGSHLADALCEAGHSVIGVDAFIPYYPRSIKEDNLAQLRNQPNFCFRELDLRFADLTGLLEGVDTVFHLAAMPGLMLSWSDFDLYNTCNLLATQRLLEAARAHKLKQFIYGSTSSVYGRFANGPENLPLHPVSPYGVTKLGAENLCQAYAETFDLPLTILRFFSVYGPRQRPDMAYHKFIEALLKNEPITIFGDGEQSRSNTYVTDCVKGIMLAFENPEHSLGQIFNLGGGEVVTINQVLQILTEISGRIPELIFKPARPGDQRSTQADTTRAYQLLGFKPTTSVEAGLQNQYAWQQKKPPLELVSRL